MSTVFSGYHFQNKPAGIHKSPDSLNLLSPKSDQHEISPHNINALENSGHENRVHDK